MGKFCEGSILCKCLYLSLSSLSLFLVVSDIKTASHSSVSKLPISCLKVLLLHLLYPLLLISTHSLLTPKAVLSQCPPTVPTILPVCICRSPNCCLLLCCSTRSEGKQGCVAAVKEMECVQVPIDCSKDENSFFVIASLVPERMF